MAVLPVKDPFTLLVEEAGAEVWGPEGARVAELGTAATRPERRKAWGDALKEHLPPGAQVQILFRQPSLAVLCQDAPALSAKERREVAARLIAAEAGEEAFNWGAGQDADAHAEGGHQLWVAGHPAWEMQDWLAALQGAGASLVYAGPWQRALLAGLGEGGRDRLLLTLEASGGTLIFFRGRALVLQRTFRLPEGVDPAVLDEADGELLVEAVVEELSRTLQFLKQKHRGVGFEDIQVVGLATPPASMEERLARGLRLKLRLLAPGVRAYLLQGAHKERELKDGLTLVPAEVLEAHKLRALRLAVWGAAALVLALCAGVGAKVVSEERALRQEAERAEASLSQRKALQADQERASRARFPLLRLRTAEARQLQATRALDGLTRALMAVPEGIVLERVEVTQAPGDKLQHRFTVAGVALTERRFSVGPLALYVAQLSARPGLVLSPMREVAVLDRRLDGARGIEEHALARFTLEGLEGLEGAAP